MFSMFPCYKDVGMPDHQITPLKYRNEQTVLSNLDEKVLIGGIVMQESGDGIAGEMG